MIIDISAAVTWYLSDCSGRNLSPKTQKCYRERLAHLTADLGDRPVASIAPPDLKIWLQARAQLRGWSATSTNLMVITLKVFFKFLIEEEVIDANPATKLRKLKTDTVLPEPFSDDEIRGLLGSCTNTWLGTRDKAMIVTLLDTGLRLQELLDLTTADVRLEVGSLLVRRGKGGKGRVVPYSAPVRRVMMKYLAYRASSKPDGDELWITEDGHPLGREAIKTITARWERQSGVAHVHLHRFRHSFASSYLQGGGSPAHLQHLLGHSSHEMTLRYSHLANLDSTDDHAKASPATRLLGHRWRG